MINIPKIKGINKRVNRFFEYFTNDFRCKASFEDAPAIKKKRGIWKILITHTKRIVIQLLSSEFSI